MSDKINLDDLSSQILPQNIDQAVNRATEGRIEYTRRIEDPRELESRLRREEADAEHQRILKEADAKYERILRFTINLVALLAFVVTLSVCSYVLYGTYTIDEKRLAQPILTAAVGAIGGYIFARAAK